MPTNYLGTILVDIIPSGPIETVVDFTGPAGPQGPAGPPGLTGPTGPTGPTGTPGEDVISLTTLDFIVPAVGSTVPVNIDDADWISVNQIIYIAGAGFFKVQAIATLPPVPVITVINIGDPSNVAPGTNIMAGALVTPAGSAGPIGPIGPQGIQGPVGPLGPQGPPGPAFYADTTAAATTPDTNTPVALTLSTTSGLISGVVLYISGIGYYTVTSVDSTTGAHILDPGTPSNPAPGTAIPNGTPVFGVGPQGPEGPPGPIGNTGSQGPVGQSAVTHTTAAFTAPAVNVNQSLAVVNSTWIAAGQYIYLNNIGYYLVEQVVDAQNIVIENIGAPGNSPPGTILPSGATVSAGGATGPTGPVGPTGPQGPPGPTGPIGNQGPTGPTGAVGPQGPQGAQGPVGDQGPVGNTGPAGPQGPAGPNGAQGVQGPTGPAGVGGADAYSTLSAAITTPAVAGQVTIPVVNAASFGAGQILFIAGGGYYAVNSVNTAANTLIGTAQNYPGDPVAGTVVPAGATVSGSGPRGPMGAQGPQGSQGIQGVAGAQGAQGVQGAQGNTGPQGNTGATGPIGPAGATGAAGATGPAGPTGPAGATGVAGAQGPIGPQGPTGPQGAVGAAGPAGVAACTTTTASFTVPAAGTTVVVNVVNGSWLVLGQMVWVATAGGSPTLPAVLQVSGINGNILTLLNSVPGPLPGAVVNSGSLISPGGEQGPTGAQGPNGLNSFTITSGAFTVPPVGSTVVVTVNDATFVVVGQMLAIQGAGGTGIAGSLLVQSKSGNQLTLLNPASSQIPLADSTHTGLLKQLSGNTTDFVDGTNNCQPLQPVIWSARLRSYNAVGNPSFEVDQRNVGNSVAITNAAAPLIQDRWPVAPSGATMRISAQQQSGNVLLPGTNFFITSKFLRITLTAAQASLAVGDIIQIFQNVEGPCLRELLGDVHSASLLVRSTVANLKFGLALQDNPSAHSLVKLCSLGAVNTWTLISLPNLPIWPGAGTFPIAPGGIGYYLIITLAAGSTLVAPANDTWQNGNFLGAVGQSNFAASAVNSTFDLAFVQHEPGALCTTLQDLDFDTNLNRCQKYFQKSYDYGTAIGSATYQGSRTVNTLGAANNAFGPMAFFKPLAKVPTATIYNPQTGAAGSIHNGYQAIEMPGATGQNVGITGIAWINWTTATSGAAQMHFHYTADTNW